MVAEEAPGVSNLVSGVFVVESAFCESDSWGCHSLLNSSMLSQRGAFFHDSIFSFEGYSIFMTDAGRTRPARKPDTVLGLIICCEGGQEEISMRASTISRPSPDNKLCSSVIASSLDAMAGREGLLLTFNEAFDVFGRRFDRKDPCPFGSMPLSSISGHLDTGGIGDVSQVAQYILIYNL